MKLEDFKQSVTEMSNEELMLQIKELRKKRRTTISQSRTRTLKAAGSKKRAKKTDSKKLEDLTDKLSPEQIKDMIDIITGGIE